MGVPSMWAEDGKGGMGNGEDKRVGRAAVAVMSQGLLLGKGEERRGRRAVQTVKVSGRGRENGKGGF
jgi:hypothetical protein